MVIQGMGRVDESSGIQPATLTLTLRNADGRFTPKNGSGAYSPNILRNTRIRVSVNATSSTGVAYNQFRFFGEISSWPVTNDVSQRDVSVTITASGIWRRLSQSSTPIGSPYSRYLDQLTGTSAPAASWQMEDGNGSAVFITGTGSSAAATFTGTPSFAADGTSFAGCDALPVANGARITANVTSAATPTNTVVRFALSVPAAGDSAASTFAGGAEVAKILSPSATIKRYDVSLIANQLVLHGYTAVTGGVAAFTGVITTKVNGTPVLVSAEITPSAGSINWALRIIKPGAGAVLDQVTGTRATSAIAAVTQVILDGQGRMADTAIGQLGVWYTVPSLVTAASALSGFTGEFAVDRINRLCAETGVPVTIIGSASAAMGPQPDDTLANILLDIENTDGGLLYETRDQFGLGYRTLASMKDQAAAVTISYAAGVLGAPLVPTYDDALIRNQWTVTNSDGYAAQATLTSGAISVLDVPNGVGLYAGTASINTSSHAQVNAIAQQRLFQGTVDDIRDPSMVISFLRKQAAPFFASVPGLRIGDHVQVTNRPAYDGATTSKQLAWGYSEVLTGTAWTITFNMVPELPFETAFSPGVFSVVQAPSSGVAAGGSQVGSSVSVAQLPPGSPGSSGGTISARSIGGSTSFISAATPYDWTFTVAGTPVDTTYFICTTEQALPIAVGDTFVNSGGLGGPFTVTALSAPSTGFTNVYFTPDASSAMSTGTVQGGKNGDTWVNSSGGNQVNQWASGAWVPVQFGLAAVSFTPSGAKVTFGAAPGGPATGDLWYNSATGYKLNQWNGAAWVPFQYGTGALAASSVTTNEILAGTILAGNIHAGTITSNEIAANTITSGNILANTITSSDIAAGIVIAGIVDSTLITGAQFVSYGASGQVLIYTGTPALGNITTSISSVATTDAVGNAVPEGLTIHDGGMILDNQGSAPAAVGGASAFYSSVAGRPRYLSQTGNDAVLERSEINVSQFTVGNTVTRTLISAPLSYLANEGNQSSEYELEISGIITAGSGSAQTLTFELAVDGTTPSGAGPVTLGAVFLAPVSATFAYAIRFQLHIVTSGAGGTVNIVVDGQVSKRAVNAGSSTTPVPTVAIGEVGTGKAFDTTANHTLRVYATWGGTSTGESLTTYRTKIARRM